VPSERSPIYPGRKFVQREQRARRVNQGFEYIGDCVRRLLHCLLYFRTVRGLAFQAEGPGVVTLAAEFERPEIFLPRAVGNIPGMPTPFLQREQVVHRDLPLPCPVEEVLSKLRWEIEPLNLRHQ
jgi:hypothetical protein